MSLSVYGKEYGGRSFGEVFPPFTTDRTAHKYLIKKIAEHIRGGGFVHVELTRGARKGTVARWDIDADAMADLYQEVRNGYGEVMAASADIRLVFDDRDTVIPAAIRYGDGIQGIVHFDRTKTLWSYETKAQPKVEAKVLHDHFGVELAVGQLVLVPQGKKGETRTRFAHIVGITDKGTIKVESIKTRESHDKTTSNVSPTIYAKDKVLMARLSH